MLTAKIEHKKYKISQAKTIFTQLTPPNSTKLIVIQVFKRKKQ